MNSLAVVKHIDNWRIEKLSPCAQTLSSRILRAARVDRPQLVYGRESSRRETARPAIAAAAWITSQAVTGRHCCQYSGGGTTINTGERSMFPASFLRVSTPVNGKRGPFLTRPSFDSTPWSFLRTV